jgi:predicted RNA-binding Zn-ribbon protein involved in translation (DUF1610 family)
MKKGAPVAPVTLGADPEFELVVGGEVVSASRVLREDIRLPWGVIGTDGAGYPLELRPAPSEHPKVLVANVGRLLLAVPKVVGGWPSSLCEVHAIGGHVHIGGLRGSYEELKGIVNVIDDALGDVFYSLSPSLRIRQGYGRRGDWRQQTWGVEYRTPPASAWAHPKAALTFLGAIKWVVTELLKGENPLRSPSLTKVRAAVKRAADFVKKYDGRLHWGAWKALLGEVDPVKHLGVKVSFASNFERDGYLLEDLKAMCVRLGITSLRVTPLSKRRGDYATNVPGYGELSDEFPTFRLGEALCLSWRFRNDRSFRLAEMPKLEAAMAAVLKSNEEEGDKGRLVKEVVYLSGKWPEVPPPKLPKCVSCGGFCGPTCHYYNGEPYCNECAEEELVRCYECDTLLHRDDAHYDNDGDPFCEDCYHEYYTRCASCDREVRRNDAYTVDGVNYCPDCYHELFTTCTACGEPVYRDEAWVYDGDPYCESCYSHLFAFCEWCEEDYPAELVHSVRVIERGQERELSLCEDCLETLEYDAERDVYVFVEEE